MIPLSLKAAPVCGLLFDFAVAVTVDPSRPRSIGYNTINNKNLPFHQKQVELLTEEQVQIFRRCFALLYTVLDGSPVKGE